LTEFLGLKQLATKNGLDRRSTLNSQCKISKEPGKKTENFAITTDGQWQLELPSLLVDEKVSSVAVAVGKARPRQVDEYDTDSEEGVQT